MKIWCVCVCVCVFIFRDGKADKIPKISFPICFVMNCYEHVGHAQATAAGHNCKKKYQGFILAFVLQQREILNPVLFFKCFCEDGTLESKRTVVAEMITELIRLYPQWKLIGIQERSCICNERFSAEIPRDLSLVMESNSSCSAILYL